MSDVLEVKCPKAVYHRKTIKCGNTDVFCIYQRYCPVKNRGVLTDDAKNCIRRDDIKK